MSRLRAFFGRIVARIRRLPKLLLATLGLLAVVALLVGGVFAYRTWDYIEHDNDFCMSCHLMQEPYERFAESAHQGLGCKACHHPTLVGRSRMALTQILENPDVLGEHAVVPNEKCVECHVDGDPERWTQISQSVGHRLHLESEDTSLSGLRCVQCHSSGVHEFAATSQTCAQSGCHENVEIKLGRMGDFTIHCVACHDFSRPVPENTPVAVGDSGPHRTVVSPLRPEANECLSCHQMRLLVGDIPADEPHGAVCGACHNPHEDETPADAVRSCAGSGCHASADSITPMHRGIDEATLASCTLCHSPHDSPIDDDVRCASCHTDAARMDDGPGDFRHEVHDDVQCASCHDSRESHGEVAVAGGSCMECHHSGATVARVQCASCHEQQRASGTVHRARVSIEGRTRDVPFTHARHQSVTCTSCHAPGLEMSAASVNCTSCHTNHHRPDAVCRNCHVGERRGSHRMEVVHTGCAGSGCHTALPFRDRPNTREFCLTCHQDQVRHNPGRACASCHAMPEWRGTVSR